MSKFSPVIDTGLGWQNRALRRQERHRRETTAKLAQIQAGALGTADSLSATTSYRRVTTDTVLTPSDAVVSADATAGNILLTMPSAASCTGRQFRIKKWDTTTNTVTLVGTIDGASGFVLMGSARPSVTVVSNGTDYELV